MADALLGGVLPTIYSKADELKRGLVNWLRSPTEQAKNVGSEIVGAHLQHQNLMKQAFGNPNNPLEITDPVAMQQAKFVAKQIERLSKKQALQSFRYVDKGSMATIGRHKAVVEVKGIGIGGVIAWYMWLWLHLFYLLGGRNKIGTMADWTWNYLTFDRGNRHIMDIS